MDSRCGVIQRQLLRTLFLMEYCTITEDLEVRKKPRGMENSDEKLRTFELVILKRKLIRSDV